MKSDAELAVSMDEPYPLVDAAVRALLRQGWRIRQARATGPAVQWAKAMAEEVASGKLRAAVVFCQGPELACCVANKVAGARAVPVSTAAQLNRALLEAAPNLLAVEMPGRTYFEVRHMVLAFFSQGPCPEALLRAIGEVEAGAHH
jgi:ribose 5-phosphate isomerase RpiB